MANLSENITRAIDDFDGIKRAIEYHGLTVYPNTPTSFYEDMVMSVAERFRIPVTVTARTADDPLPGQPLFIQTGVGGIQRTFLDENGEFRNSLRTATNYTFTVMTGSPGDKIFSQSKTVTTGTLDLPLLIEFLMIRINDPGFTDVKSWEDIKSVIESNKGKIFTRDTATFGDLAGTNKWYAGVLAPNGRIYGIPNNSTSILEIDPETQTASTFGDLTGTSKWIGGVLAPNGKIYGIPRDATTVLEIDPETRIASTFGDLAGANKWYAGVLAPNGRIYGIPSDATTILEIDPEMRTTSTFGNFAGTNKWAAGVLAPNGKIYGIPRDATTILEIDPETRTASTFGNLAGTTKWIGGVLAPNGKIYGIPSNSTSILEIDPETRTASTFGNLAGTGKWSGGVLAPNGKIYGIPSNSTSILEIDFGAYLTNFNSLPLLSTWMNKF